MEEGVVDVVGLEEEEAGPDAAAVGGWSSCWSRRGAFLTGLVAVM